MSSSWDRDEPNIMAFYQGSNGASAPPAKPVSRGNNSVPQPHSKPVSRGNNSVPQPPSRHIYRGNNSLQRPSARGNNGAYFPYDDFDAFGQANFMDGVPTSFTRKELRNKLLRTTPDEDRQACISICKVILKFMGDKQDYRSNMSKTYQTNMGTVMSRLYDKLGVSPTERDQQSTDHVFPSDTPSGKSLDPELLVRTLEKKASRKGRGGTLRRLKATLTARFFRSEHKSVFHSLPLEDTLRTPLEYLHLIIGYGILKPELRDEIYCQVCKQLIGNPFKHGVASGWTLLFLIASCFPPSHALLRVIMGFLDDSPPINAIQCKKNLHRTLENGCRFQPPSLLELEAVVRRIPLEVSVTLMDGSLHALTVDSATTAKELANQLTELIHLKQKMGFSVYISMFEKVASLGNGSDHLLDAISQCEQIHADTGGKEGDAPWRLFFRKEMFSPWEPWVTDSVATDLIFAQVVRGIILGEYIDVEDNELAMIAAQQYYIEYGADITECGVLPLLSSYVPPDRLIEEDGLDRWSALIVKAHRKLFQNSPHKDPERVKQEVVHFAKFKWALAFSRYYDVRRVEGNSEWADQELCLAVNWKGVYIQEDGLTLHEMSYPEILSVSEGGSANGQTVMFVLVTGATAEFSCADGDDLRDLVEYMLMGLKKRSTFAVAVQYHEGDGETDISLREGDLLLLSEPHVGRAQRPLVVSGCNDRTQQQGHIRTDHIYVLPALTRPSGHVLKLFQKREIKAS